MNRIRKLCGTFVNDEHVRIFITVLIIVNSATMGIETYKVVSENEQLYQAFQTADLCMLVLFTIEVVLQFIYHGIYMFRDPWLSFDFIIIAISWANSYVIILRSFRIFRALRLANRFKHIRRTVEIVSEAFQTILHIFALLIFVMYVYAVLFTILFKDMYGKGQTTINYFSRLDLSFFSLFQIMTLNDWGIIAREVMVIYPWAWIVFISYIVLTSFILMNIITGVFCEAFLRSNNSDELELNVSGVIRSMKQKNSRSSSSSSSTTFESSQIQNDTHNLDNDEEESLSLQFIHDEINIIILQLSSVKQSQQETIQKLEFYVKPNEPVETSKEPITLSANSENNKKLSMKNIREFCGVIVQNKLTKRLVIILLVMNGVMMGIRTNKTIRTDPNLTRAFEIVDISILSIFTAEISLQLLYHGLEIINDYWLIFDSLIILLSWISIIISTDNAVHFQVFLSFRLTRLISRVKFLRESFNALAYSIPSLLCLGTLLICGIYIFSVVFTSYFKDLYDDGLTTDNFFSRLDCTCFTLFQIMTLSSWSDIVREVMVTHSWAGVLFVMYIFVTSFVLMNMFVSYIALSYSITNNEKKSNDDEDNIEAATADKFPWTCMHNEINDAADTIHKLTQSLDEIVKLINQLKMKDNITKNQEKTTKL